VLRAVDRQQDLHAHSSDTSVIPHASGSKHPEAGAIFAARSWRGGQERETATRVMGSMEYARRDARAPPKTKASSGPAMMQAIGVFEGAISSERFVLKSCVTECNACQGDSWISVCLRSASPMRRAARLIASYA
jgi:hypothetical protein